MDTVKIARVGLHHFEEPCISGTKGSGTIFFSGCNLKCLFCQNYEISHSGKGIEITFEQFESAIKYLVDLDAENINLVTPGNYSARLIPMLEKIKPRLNIPIVWNSSGYESVKSIKNTDGLIDIYMPDFKYSDNALAEEYSGAKKYCEIANDAIAEMRRIKPYDIFNGDGIMKSGVIVRHLVLPGALENTRGVLNKISDIDASLYVSLMSQYFPTDNVKNHKFLGRRLTSAEYDLAVEYFFDAGLKNGFSQDIDSATEEYVPYFDLEALKKIVC